MSRFAILDILSAKELPIPGVGKINRIGRLARLDCFSGIDRLRYIYASLRIFERPAICKTDNLISTLVSSPEIFLRIIIFPSLLLSLLFSFLTIHIFILLAFFLFFISLLLCNAFLLLPLCALSKTLNKERMLPSLESRFFLSASVPFPRPSFLLRDLGIFPLWFC